MSSHHRPQLRPYLTAAHAHQPPAQSRQGVRTTTTAFACRPAQLPSPPHELECVKLFDGTRTLLRRPACRPMRLARRPDRPAVHEIGPWPRSSTRRCSSTAPRFRARRRRPRPPAVRASASTRPTPPRLREQLARPVHRRRRPGLPGVRAPDGTAPGRPRCRTSTTAAAASPTPGRSRNWSSVRRRRCSSSSARRTTAGTASR